MRSKLMLLAVAAMLAAVPHHVAFALDQRDVQRDLASCDQSADWDRKVAGCSKVLAEVGSRLRMRSKKSISKSSCDRLRSVESRQTVSSSSSTSFEPFSFSLGMMCFIPCDEGPEIPEYCDIVPRSGGNLPAGYYTRRS